MRQRLPSLNALRVFATVARYGSLSAAARELHVTPAAVSHQLKALEADLGVTLLTRINHQYVLSDEAQAALPMLSSGFEYITEAVRRLRTDAARKLLTVSVNPSFAATWLVRRLAKFDELFPNIDVRMLVTNELANFAEDGVDVAIRFGKGHYRGLVAIHLFDEAFMPVCSPALLNDCTLNIPGEVLQYPLLHVDWSQVESSEALDWPRWLSAAGVAFDTPLAGPCFKYTSYAVQAAIEGKGIALAGNKMTIDEVRAGRLRRPFALQVAGNHACYLAYPEAAKAMHKLVAFREWLLDEVQQDDALDV